MSLTLTNYWWLLIWIFTVGTLLNQKFPKQPIMVMGKIEYRWSVIAVVILVTPYIIWAGARGHFADTNAYRIMFSQAPTEWSGLRAYMENIPEDVNFFFVSAIIKIIFGNSEIIYFTIIATFQMICVAYLFRRYSSDFWISFFLFIVSVNYLSWMFNGTRQFVAVCICMLATKYVLQKKYLVSSMLIILASSFHGTAIIMLPIFFIAQGEAWNRKTILFIGLTILAVFYVGNFTNLLNDVLVGTQYSDVMSSDIWLEDDGTNVIRVLVNAIPAILSFLGKNQIEKENDQLINFCTNMSIIALGIYLVSMVTSGIFVGRLPIYMILYSYILLPWEIENLFTEESKKIVYVMMYGGYLLFFYYQMHVAFSLI